MPALQKVAFDHNTIQLIPEKTIILICRGGFCLLDGMTAAIAVSVLQDQSLQVLPYHVW